MHDNQKPNSMRVTPGLLRGLKISALTVMACLLLVTSCEQKDNSTDNTILPSSKKTANVSAVALPGGRANYVVAFMGGPSNIAKFASIRTYKFTAGTGSAVRGTVNSMSWIWNQSTFTGNASVNKLNTGYTTTGCTNAGVVRTAKGFEPGSSTPNGSPITGEYYLDVNGRLFIEWASGKTEIWTISHPKTYYSKLTLFNSSYAIEHGWGFGSNAPLTGVGATINQIRAAGNLSNVECWYNKYNFANQEHAPTYFPVDIYQACVSNPSAMQKPEPEPNYCDRYHSYVAGNPAVDGRKNYWNHQLGVVGCADAGTPCPTTNCTQRYISAGGGHTYQMLQVLDDNNVFRGWVAVEASLHAKVSGSAVVGASYWMQP